MGGSCSVAPRQSGHTLLLLEIRHRAKPTSSCRGREWLSGAPIELLNENCTDAGGGWRDKSLGVRRIADL
jgi:hypothetical protein